MNKHQAQRAAEGFAAYDKQVIEDYKKDPHAFMVDFLYRKKAAESYPMKKSIVTVIWTLIVTQLLLALAVPLKGLTGEAWQAAVGLDIALWVIALFIMVSAIWIVRSDFEDNNREQINIAYIEQILKQQGWYR